MLWHEHLQRQELRYRDGLERLPEDPDSRQRQLTRVANAALGAGFAELMAGNQFEAEKWLLDAATWYRKSYEGAPIESWGRMIGALKLRLIAGDDSGVLSDAEWTLGNGAEQAVSPIGRYAACLAHLVLEDDFLAAEIAVELQSSEGFPKDVAGALYGVASRNRVLYGTAINSVLRSFEMRAEYLEDIPIADTVIMLNVLAEKRNIRHVMTSSLLPLENS